MKIDWTKVKEGFSLMDVLKEENKELKQEIERLSNELQIQIEDNVRLNEYIEEIEKNKKIC